MCTLTCPHEAPHVEHDAAGAVQPAGRLPGVLVRGVVGAAAPHVLLLPLRLQAGQGPARKTHKLVGKERWSRARRLCRRGAASSRQAAVQAARARCQPSSRTPPSPGRASPAAAATARAAGRAGPGARRARRRIPAMRAAPRSPAGCRGRRRPWRRPARPAGPPRWRTGPPGGVGGRRAGVEGRQTKVCVGGGLGAGGL